RFLPITPSGVGPQLMPPLAPALFGLTVITSRSGTVAGALPDEVPAGDTLACCAKRHTIEPKIAAPANTLLHRPSMPAFLSSAITSRSKLNNCQLTARELFFRPSPTNLLGISVTSASAEGATLYQPRAKPWGIAPKHIPRAESPLYWRMPRPPTHMRSGQKRTRHHSRPGYWLFSPDFELSSPQIASTTSNLFICLHLKILPEWHNSYAPAATIEIEHYWQRTAPYAGLPGWTS